MTIKANIFAGLGNQLFIIFATISYALDHNIPFELISYKDRTTNGTKTYWNSFLDSLNDDIDLNVQSDITMYNNVYYEPLFEYIPIPDSVAKSDCVLHGYFQSHKYFEHNYKKIVQLMKLDQKVLSVKDEYSHLFAKKTIAIHFRLGDYIGLQNYHCIKQPSYYIQALQELSQDLQLKGENILDYNILYFCQETDKQYIDQYLKVFHSVISPHLNFIKVPDSIEDWTQMLIMSLCNHFIIANSTYSWFGAYFSSSENKVVYRPNVWFGPANQSHNTKDLCPVDWKVIDC